MKFYVSILISGLLVGCSAGVLASIKKLQVQLPIDIGVGTLSSIPGTSIILPAPDGFVPAKRFLGFMKESTGSSIMVSEIPRPYIEVTSGFSNKRQMQARGMTLLDHSLVKIENQRAMLLNVEQPAYGTMFRKWMLVVDRPGSTALIVASFPKSEAEQGEQLKASILAISFGKPSDPAASLAFVAKSIVPFEVAKIMGQNMLLTPNGRFPLKGENIPFMTLGMSVSEDFSIPNQKAFSEYRITNTATVKHIRTEQTIPITIGYLSGYATTSYGTGEDAATPLTIYQIILFAKSGYSIIQGVTPTAQKETYLPIFEQIAKTFKMKELDNKIIENDKKQSR